MLVKRIIGIRPLLFLVIMMTWMDANLRFAAASQASVVQVNGHPALQIDGRNVPPQAYMSYLGCNTYYREAASAGLHLYFLSASLGDRGINPRSGIGPFHSALWLAEDKYDCASLLNELKTLLDADPQALVILRLYLDPPQWWEKAHPEGCCRLADGTSFRQCFASPLWRDATAKALRECLRRLNDSPYADRLIGVHVAAGGTEEWFYHYGGTLKDLNPACVSSFRSWLDQFYLGDLSALQKNWRDPLVRFDTASPVDFGAMVPALRWRHHETERPLIDTFRFHNELIADNIAFFCQVVKQASDRKLLTGAFYGYHFNLPDPRMGHFALSKLLRCPDLDYLSSPNDYNRVTGEDWPPMAAVGSVQLHGKLWFAENDTRTFKTTLLKDRAPAICPPHQYEGGLWVGPSSPEESIALLRKNTARMLAGGYGGWWFDMWGGWFSDPQLLAILHRTQELSMVQPSSDVVSRMQPQVCVIADEELSYLDASFGELTSAILANRHPLGKVGAPYDFYLREDMHAISPRVIGQQYRFVWLLGVCNLTGEEQALMKRWTDSGATVCRTYQEGTEIRCPRSPVPEQMRGKFQLKPAELREMWIRAGVHLYNDHDDVLYAGHGWLGLHSAQGGLKQLKLPFRAKVTDAFGPLKFPDACQVVVLNLDPGETILLRIETLVESMCGERYSTSIVPG